MTGHLEYMQKYAGSQLTYGILDVGCGMGGFVVAAAIGGYRAEGIEFNPHKVKIAQKKIADAGLDAIVRQGSAEKMPYSDSSFGFVNCNEVSEHVEDTQAVLVEIYRVMKGDGAAYISFHNRFGIIDQHFHIFAINWMPRSWADAICRKTKKLERGSEKFDRQMLGEMHYFTYRQVVQMLIDIGFEIQDTREIRIRNTFKNLVVKSLILAIYRIFRLTFINTFHVIVTKA